MRDGPPHDQIPVLLLKTRSTPIDGYEDLFEAVEDGIFDPLFVPVLEHKFREESLDWLRGLIVRGSFASTVSDQSCADNVATRFGGIIFTSQRAVEAFGNLVHELEGHKREALLPQQLPLYVVGPATAKGLRSLHLQCQIVGEETGNGEALARFILNHYNDSAPRSSAGAKRPLLFLVGEQRRDIIPRMLQSKDLAAEQRIEVIESTVYETREMESFEADLTKAFTRGTDSRRRERWIVVFSPTGGQAMLRVLGWLDESTGRYQTSLTAADAMATYVATIGPTTRKYLVDNFSFEPHVCAEKPSAEGIYSEIQAYRSYKLNSQ